MSGVQSESHLSVNAACAGLALACAYSSSDEYEAEVIAARRAAGVYGPRRSHQVLTVFAVAVAGIAILCIL